MEKPKSNAKVVRAVIVAAVFSLCIMVAFRDMDIRTFATALSYYALGITVGYVLWSR